ncbi:MAG: serine hydrolase domain-containing protein [Pyrinomonadaceae bacterium]
MKFTVLIFFLFLFFPASGSAQGVEGDALTEKTGRKLTESQMISEAKKHLEELSRKGEFSGSVLIASGGKPIFSEAYGLADRDRGIVNKTDTKFNLGSINKLFTILAVGILADEGKLSFADRLGKHLPDYPNKEAREKVTIEHLLTMQSGIGDIFGPKYETTPKSKLRSIKDYLPLFENEPLAFEPGTDRQYSNGGFLVLGAIIEKISGKTYYDFVRQRIFKPIGMSDTESFESGERVANMAEGYMFSEESKKLINNVATRPARGSSAGGGYSTAPDLLKFANALESGTFPTPKSLNSVRDPMLNGLGQGILRFAGGAPGINATISNKIKGKYTLIVLSNLDPPSANQASRKIDGLIESIESD